MSLATFLAFLFLSSSLLSLWIRPIPALWGTLLGASIVSAWIAGNIILVGIIFIIFLSLLWVLYDYQPNIILFLLLICTSTLFKMKILPGFTPYFFTPKFAIGFEGPLIGLFPLALLVPLSKNIKDWILAFKGLIIGCIGIAILAVLATFGGIVHWQFKLPSFAFARILSNLLFTSIPEEGFYRGFIQNTLCNYFEKIRFGKTLALVLSSILFTTAHIYWSPNLETLVFVFFASLLYGGIYLTSGKIESSIICHFLLNFIHMTFFSYHAI